MSLYVTEFTYTTGRPRAAFFSAIPLQCSLGIRPTLVLLCTTACTVIPHLRTELFIVIEKD